MRPPAASRMSSSEQARPRYMPARLRPWYMPLPPSTSSRLRGHRAQPSAGGIENRGGQDAEPQHGAGVGQGEACPARPPADTAVGVSEHRVRDNRRGRGIQGEPGGEDEGRTRSRAVPPGQEPGKRRRDQNRSQPGLAGAHPGGQSHREQRIAGDQLRSSGEHRTAGERIAGSAPGDSQRKHAECKSGRENGEPQYTRHGPILASPGRRDNQ